jgi:hypothetical protein
MMFWKIPLDAHALSNTVGQYSDDQLHRHRVDFGRRFASPPQVFCVINALFLRGDVAYGIDVVDIECDHCFVELRSANGCAIAQAFVTVVVDEDAVAADELVDAAA